MGSKERILFTLRNEGKGFWHGNNGKEPQSVFRKLLELQAGECCWDLNYKRSDGGTRETVQLSQARSALVEHPSSVPSTRMVVQEISCSSDLQQACMWCIYTHTGKAFIHRKWNQSWGERNKGRRNQTREKAYTIHRWVLIFILWEVKTIIIIFLIFKVVFIELSRIKR